jgi:hypothetical protein
MACRIIKTTMFNLSWGFLPLAQHWIHFHFLNHGSDQKDFQIAIIGDCGSQLGILLEIILLCKSDEILLNLGRVCVVARPFSVWFK